MFSKRRKDKLSEEEREIEKKREEILRKKDELENRLVRLPAEMAAQKETALEMQRERARAAQMSNIATVRQGVRRSRPTPKSQLRKEILFFLILLLALIVMSCIVWMVAIK